MLFTFSFLLAVLVFWMTWWYFVANYFRRTDIVDMVWGLSYWLIAIFLFFIFDSSLLTLVPLCFIVLWSVRLVLHIISRLRNHPEDSRYAAFRNSWWKYFSLKSYFYIFGVRDNNIWISWDQVEEYSYLLDIPTVPVLFKGVVSSEKELKDLTESLSKEPSALGGLREGIVVRNADIFHNDDFSDNLMKWVRKGHVQTDQHWTRDWKKAKII